MRIKIVPNAHAAPVGKLADAEITFDEAPLDGLKLVGFAVWETRDGFNVTFPARVYSVNGERRSFSLLRPVTSPDVTERLKGHVLEAYRAHVAGGGQ